MNARAALAEPRKAAQHTVVDCGSEPRRADRCAWLCAPAVWTPVCGVSDGIQSIALSHAHHDAAVTARGRALAFVALQWPFGTHSLTCSAPPAEIGCLAFRFFTAVLEAVVVVVAAGAAGGAGTCVVLRVWGG